MHGVSIFGRISWGFGLTLLAYLAFLIRETIAAGPNRAIGVGALVVILYNSWFWTTAALVFALALLWKSN